MFLDFSHRAKGHPCYSTALPTSQALFSVVFKRLSCSKWWSTRLRPSLLWKISGQDGMPGRSERPPSTKRRECSAIKFTTMLTKFPRYCALFCHPQESNGVVGLLAGELWRGNSSCGDLRLWVFEWLKYRRSGDFFSKQLARSEKLKDVVYSGVALVLSFYLPPCWHHAFFLSVN